MVVRFRGRPCMVHIPPTETMYDPYLSEAVRLSLALLDLMVLFEKGALSSIPQKNAWGCPLGLIEAQTCTN